MRNFIYLIAIVLIVIWASSLLFYNPGSFIHLLLVVALVVVVMNLTRNDVR